MSLGVFPPLNLFKEFEKNQYEFLLVCLVKFTCEATWSLTFVCRELFTDSILLLVVGLSKLFISSMFSFGGL